MRADCQIPVIRSSRTLVQACRSDNHMSLQDCRLQIAGPDTGAMPVPDIGRRAEVRRLESIQPPATLLSSMLAGPNRRRATNLARLVVSWNLPPYMILADQPTQTSSRDLGVRSWISDRRDTRDKRFLGLLRHRSSPRAEGDTVTINQTARQMSSQLPDMIADRVSRPNQALVRHSTSGPLYPKLNTLERVVSAAQRPRCRGHHPQQFQEHMAGSESTMILCQLHHSRRHRRTYPKHVIRAVYVGHTLFLLDNRLPSWPGRQQRDEGAGMDAT